MIQIATVIQWIKRLAQKEITEESLEYRSLEDRFTNGNNYINNNKNINKSAVNYPAALYMQLFNITIFMFTTSVTLELPKGLYQQQQTTPVSYTHLTLNIIVYISLHVNEL